MKAGLSTRNRCLDFIEPENRYTSEMTYNDNLKYSMS